MTTIAAPNQLNAMTFPLHGTRLIEASAGTGKTFTIASLYLRLLLGHGDEGTRHQEELTVDRILVVTFTEAATAELRERVRAKIHDARLAFARAVHNHDYKSGDPVIDPLLASIGDHKSAAQILLNAERSMDEASIFTIHGFCQRMLTQNAFESGAQFESEFVTDQAKLMHQVAADFWRRSFYHLPKMVAESVYDCWSSPSALLGDMGNSLTGVPKHLTVEPLENSLEEFCQQGIARIDELKKQWSEHCSDFEALIAGSGVDKRSYTKKNLPNWLEQVSSWANNPTTSLQVHDKLEKFSQELLIEKTKKGEAPEHAVFKLIDDFLAQPLEIKQPLLSLAIHQCRKTLQQAKEQKNWLSFDDLLTQLSQATENQDNALLLEKIREQYPVALIDEFQDTDPLQYSIFSTLYQDQPQCGLFMIGDPKQAIYAFRGADIFTYIQARRQVVDHYTLDTNWRSTADMVSSVNRIFEHGKQPFLYDDDIPFYPVKYNPVNAEQKSWALDNHTQPAMTFWLQESKDGNPVNKTSYQRVMAESTAAQIQTILTGAQQGSAYLQNGEKKQAIKAGDIAVLVRTGKEGKLVREALSKQGIASVYLSNRDSVFSSPLAKDVLRLLQAAMMPTDARAVRSALASSLFAYTADQLHKFNVDEMQWEQAVNEFRAYRKHWQQRGIMPMLHQIITQQGISERLLAENGGERQLTDLLHIGELLQQTSQTLDSDYGLLRWLSDSISEPNGDSEEQTVRLESERNLVQIVTIHKSKGLEYDLVFLPFVCSYRAIDKKGEVSFYDEDNRYSVLDLLKEDDSVEKAEKERLAEDLRLIYVALTRAVYACYIGMAPITKGISKKPPTGVHLSGLGYLIQQADECNVEELKACLEKLIAGNSPMVIQSPQTTTDELYQEVQDEHIELHANKLIEPVKSNWWMTSYSGLVKQGNHHNDASLELINLDIDSAEDKDDKELDLEPERTIFTFPRGARAGTFLHSLFEEVEFTQPITSEENTQIIIKLLEKENYDAEWLEVVQSMMQRVLDCPLDGENLRLASKGPTQRLVEMEFLLPIKLLNSSLVNKIIAKHDEVSARAGELGFSTVSGMLKGFIDLVFEHEGKYYVLDWKSNHLGDSPEYYGGDALVEAMRDHRYDFQYQLYALALHRFLKSRIADYDYDTHFGGAYYIFLRGVEETHEGRDTNSNGVFYSKPSKALLEELEKLVDGETVDA
ncbi:exodeoxyribonuclease V subunit beta [Aliivibrio fischeri]|uniref:exodeoxyribonuclease V subunit beta n=1 Tax=Aliivibrio fischeri TaxID=668 RepID=UPI00080DBDDE|nr:exodeoxyribonuclease V subunit beta [Aliivibrio fischeri]OCH07245.1 exodeoxyribonuclease V subunit beta [Aliivibrio fischeri]OCH33748.1 exodeoxyribonuclease V subunit beta [Aliivibrio fischeri]